MNNKLLYTFGALGLQLLGYFVGTLVYKGSLSEFFLICLIGIVLLGSAILFIKAKEDQFIGRFMIATTVQMLSALSIIAAIVYIKVPESFTQALIFIFCFLGHLLLQSIFLIYSTKKRHN